MHSTSIYSINPKFTTGILGYESSLGDGELASLKFVCGILGHVQHAEGSHDLVVGREGEHVALNDVFDHDSRPQLDSTVRKDARMLVPPIHLQQVGHDVSRTLIKYFRRSVAGALRSAKWNTQTRVLPSSLLSAKHVRSRWKA